MGENSHPCGGSYMLEEMCQYSYSCKKNRGSYYPLHNKIVKSNCVRMLTKTVENDYAFCSVESDRLVFVFAGSDDIKDWVNDFKRGNNDWIKHNHIHKGFYFSYEPFKKWVTTIVAQHFNKDIYVTGHSRGGALALLCAYNLGLREHKVSCITFGAPKVFKKRKKFNLLSIYNTNVIIKRDKVPRLPYSFKRTGKTVVLKSRWFYYLPMGWVKAHLDYLNNLTRRKRWQETSQKFKTLLIGRTTH